MQSQNKMTERKENKSIIRVSETVPLAMFGVDTPAVVGDDADVAGVMGEGDDIWLSGAAEDEVGTDEGDVRVLLFSGDICDVSAAAAL